MAKSKLEIYSCVVCGEGVMWDDSSCPPACLTHVYREVVEAVDRIQTEHEQIYERIHQRVAQNAKDENG